MKNFCFIERKIKMASEKKIILVAVDIERTGSFMIKNKTLSIGFYIGDGIGNKLSTHKFNTTVKWPKYGEETEILDYGDFEPRCWDEFWVKLQHSIVEKCVENAKSEKETWTEVADFLNDLEIKYPESEYEIKFLSDNPAFDIGNIDYGLEKYANRLPMRYSSKGVYRSVIASDDMIGMLSGKEFQITQTLINNQVEQQYLHDPIYDANKIYLQYIYALLYKEKKD